MFASTVAEGQSHTDKGCMRGRQQDNSARDIAAEERSARLGSRSMLGNQAMLRRTMLYGPSQSQSSLSRPGVIQRKLIVAAAGPVDDPLELEASHVADAVMRMPEPPAGLAPLASPARQDAAPSIRRTCAACEEEEAKMVRPKRASSASASETEAPEAVHEVMRSTGSPLDAATRAFFEARMGHDFSSVRVHADGKAAASAARIGARAYAVGNRIVLNRGEYAPASAAGKHLLAHELAHVVQQERGTGVVHRQTAPPAAGAGPAPAPSTSAMLHACDPTTQYSVFTAAVTAAQGMLNDAVRGLRALIAIWGREPQSVDELAANNALAKGFNIAFDKTIWVSVLGMDAAQVRTRDARDRAAVTTILANFQQIQSDVAHYASPPACQAHMSSGATCVGCVEGRHPTCQSTDGDVIAWVPHPFLGTPSSPMLLCPGFFGLSPDERAGTVIHELAHLQTFAASDYSGASRYYGCPVMPVTAGAPGLMDPSDILRIADAYRCFVVTQASSATAFRQVAAGQAAAQSALAGATNTP